MNKKIFEVSICIFLISLTILGCGRARVEKEKVVATINKEPLYIKDLNRDIALSFKRDPLFKITPETLENQLNMTIDKRLLIQEAKRMDLDQTSIFVNTIKTFWEQTLIRDLIGRKDKEFEKAVSVSEEEIRDYYDKLSQEESLSMAPFDEMKEGIIEEIKDHKKRRLFNSWLEEIRKDADVEINNDILKGLQYKYSRE